MSILNRSSAPIADELWQEIEAEASEILDVKLSGRQIVETEGPRGAGFAALNTGRREQLDAGNGDVALALRETLPAVELEVPFVVDRSELEALLRGCEAPELDTVREAANQVASSENNILYYGLDPAGLSGLVEASENQSLNVSDEPDQFVARVSSGISRLRQNGVAGPYSLVLTPDFFNDLQTSYHRGYPLELRLEKMLGGEIILESELDESGLLVSQRGEDFRQIFGQELSIGYSDHTSEELELFFLESFTFQINAPEAVLILE